MSMVCLLMNKRAMKIWDSMATKEAFLISMDLAIFGEDRTKDKVGSRVFSETLKISLEVRNPKGPIDL